MTNFAKRFISLLLIVMAAISQPALACSNPPVRVALFDFPPYYELDAAGTPQGVLVELLHRVMAEAGCRWVHRYHESAPQLLESLISGDTDLALLIRHPVLEKRTTFGSKPLARLILNSYHLPGVPTIRTPEELRGKRVIVIRGYGYGGLINTLLDPQSGTTLEIGIDHREAFTLLREGRGDYLLDYQGPASQTLEALGMEQVSATTLQSIDLFFALSPHLSSAERLLSKLETALGAVRSQETTRP